MQYGQGMVRPGCWWWPNFWAERYIDRQYQIAKSIEALNFNLYSFADRYPDFPERYEAMTTYFIDTSARISTTLTSAWSGALTATSEPMRWTTDA